MLGLFLATLVSDQETLASQNVGIFKICSRRKNL